MNSNINVQNQNQAGLIDISSLVDDLWKGLKKLWWFLLIIIVGIAGSFGLRAKLTYKPYYQASATYTVSVDNAYGSSNSYYNQQTASELGVSLEYILTSNVMRTMVAETLGVESIPGSINVSVMENTNLITIGATAADGQTAYNILQAVIKTYPTVAERVIGDTKLEVMDETGIPSVPANQSGTMSAAKKGAVAGVVIDFVILLFFALTKRTVKKEEDFKKLLNVKCVGVIPRARFKKRGKKQQADAELVLMDNYRVPAGFVEAVRSMRTRTERNAREKHNQVYLVTSAIPGEGKSTVAANLAISLVAKGKTVILVDMDLRNPSSASRLGIRGNTVGTVDVIQGNAEIADTLIPYKDTRLKILPGGKPLHRTSRLLSAEAAERLIRDLRLMADYVILDTPPCAILSDAMIVAPYADSALFVVRQDYARIDRIMEGMDSLAETKIDICGCVLNEAEVGITGYGYRRSYGYGRYGYGFESKKYGYGYGGYGYGSEADQRRREQQPETSEKDGENEDES